MKYIKSKCLSVGFNNSLGQSFFDLLYKYYPHIHSYFFSVKETYQLDNGEFKQLNIDDEINKMKSYNTYGIPANILFNRNEMSNFKQYEYIIESLIDHINLTSVTVVDPLLGKEIKEKFPNLEIHTSVNYFDMDYDYINKHGFDFVGKLSPLIGIADVVNLSTTHSLHDIKLQRACREAGFKIKYIVNEGCIYHGHFNYSMFNDCNELSCFNTNGCNNVCNKVSTLYPFMELARTYVYKEELKYVDYDILKISSRHINDINIIDSIIYYWKSTERTNVVSNIGITDETYKYFMKFINDKSHCDGYCFECMKCKKNYENLLSSGIILER